MKKLSFLYFGILVCLLASCEHKELCYDHSLAAELRMVFDWKYAPDARPASMRLYLFPETGGKSLLYEFGNHTGGKITVPAGRYRALCMNSDTEFILFRNTGRYENFEVYLTNGSFPRAVPRFENTGKQSVRSTPDKLWSDHTEFMEVFVDLKGQTLTLYPKIAVRHYTVKIRNAENLESLASGEIFGSLTGMSGGLILGADRPTEEMSILPFDMKSDGESTVTADFYTFGYPQASETTQNLVVYAVLGDGKKYSFTYDVTSKIHEARDPMNVHIDIDGLPIPKPIDREGGFTPDVDEWGVLEIEITM